MGLVSTTSFVLGAILIIVGIILLIIGTIFYKKRMDDGEDVSAWIWIMVAIGILLMIIGLILILVGAFKAANAKEKKKQMAMGTDLCRQDLCY